MNGRVCTRFNSNALQNSISSALLPHPTSGQAPRFLSTATSFYIRTNVPACNGWSLLWSWLLTVTAIVIRTSMIALAAIAGGVCFASYSSARDRGTDQSPDSCSPQSFQLFQCVTNTGNAVGLCVTHDLNLILVQRTANQAMVQEKISSAQEAIESTSAHSSTFALRVNFDTKIKTFLGAFAAFENEPVAIVTEGSALVEYCKPQTTKWNQGMFSIRGKSRLLRVQNLERLGLAKPLPNPPAYPIRNR